MAFGLYGLKAREPLTGSNPNVPSKNASKRERKNLERVSHTMGCVYTLQWPYIDITMAVFHVFPRYKEINQIKFTKII